MAIRSWRGSQAVGGDDWNTAPNWSPAVVPVAGDDVELMDSTNAIAGFDNSAVDLGNVSIGPGFFPDIGAYNAGVPQYLILSFQANKRLTINGAPLSTTQAMFIEIDTTNEGAVFCESHGIVPTAGLIEDGIHLKDSSGPAVDSFYRNSGCPLTLDSGTFESLIDDGTATSVIASAITAINDYQSHGSGVNSTLAKIPAISMDVSDGEVTVDATTVLNNLVQTGGLINWNNSASVNVLAKIDGGTFDTSNAVAQPTFAAMEISGDAITTKVDLSQAIVTGNVRMNATGPVLIPPIGSDLTIT
jgi:hypothetical protein